MIRSLLDRTVGQTPTVVSDEELAALLSEAELLSELDTQVNGKIRLLRYQGLLLVQERSFEKQIFLRLVPSREHAERFIQKRLDAYERMWDGCGCKIQFRD